MIADPFHAQQIAALVRSAQSELVTTGTVSPQTQASLNQVGYEFRSGRIQAQSPGLATWLAPLAAVGGAAALPALFGAGGAAAAGGSAAAGAGGTAATVGGGIASHFLTSPVGASLIGGGISALANTWAANRQAGASDRAAQLQVEAANHAADLEAQANAATLKFLQDQEATRKAEFEKTQAQNYGIYQNREANLQPYRNWGIGAMAQLGRPIGAA